LQGYIGFAKKGYDIATNGIHTVRDIKNGEFGLHSALSQGGNWIVIAPTSFYFKN
jgi:hypothetical protein